MSCGYLTAGDRVRITAGPLIGETGVVESVGVGRSVVKLDGSPDRMSRWNDDTFATARWHIPVDNIALLIINETSLERGELA